MSHIGENVARLLAELPKGVKLLAAAKSRSPEEVLEAVEAGAVLIGENYVQEAAEARAVVGTRAEWHFIGHLQSNKVRKAVELFEVIETVDSAGLGRDIGRRATEAGRVMRVLVEVNSGREPQKFGALPEAVPDLVRELGLTPGLRVEGLMTMGPLSGEPEESRPYFRETRRLFEELCRLDLPGVAMECLSMGMTSSYKVAIEEGASLVRLGSQIFGPRQAG